MSSSDSGRKPRTLPDFFGSNSRPKKRPRVEFVKNNARPSQKSKKRHDRSRPIKVSFQLKSLDRIAISSPSCRDMCVMEAANSIPGVMLETLANSPHTKWSFDIKHLGFAMQQFQNIGNVKISAANTAVLPRLKQFKHLSESESDRVKEGISPDLFEHTLYPFQQEGVMYAISRNGRVLLGDDMGLGKTIQAIVIASYYRNDWPVLVICPSSVKLNWQDEFVRWLPVIDRTEIKVVMNGKDSVASDDVHTKVTIVSYDLVTKLQQQLSAHNYNIVICDESHYIKSKKAQRTKSIIPLLKKSRRALLLSGTPALSRPYELWTQVDALVPGLLGTSNAYGFRYCGGVRGRWGMEYKGAVDLAELHFILKQACLIRRLKSNVLDDLPSKRRTAITVQIRGKKVQKLINRVDNLGNILSQALDVPANGEENRPHWASREQRATFFELHKESGMAKLKAVCDYVSDLIEGGVKFLVFAHHLEVLDGIEETLVKQKVGYFRLDGSTPPVKRHAGVQEFQNNDDCRVALLSITAGGQGLTLTAASQVVFAELFWTPAQLLQAEDRVHRIGQKNAVNVCYVIGKNTIDDKMWPLISRKLEVLSSTLDGKAEKMDFEDVKNMEEKEGEFVVKNPKAEMSIADMFHNQSSSSKAAVITKGGDDDDGGHEDDDVDDGGHEDDDVDDDVQIMGMKFPDEVNSNGRNKGSDGSDSEAEPIGEGLEMESVDLLVMMGFDKKFALSVVRKLASENHSPGHQEFIGRAIDILQAAKEENAADGCE